MSNNPLIVKCSSCGSNVEYDIKEHGYSCKACGQETSNAEAVTNLANWRQLQQNEIKEQLHGFPYSIVHCQNCGAEFFFKENEATATCPYCNTPMIRRDYQETDSFPESIIPFNITLEEAKKKLQDYLNQSGYKFKEEAEIAQKNIDKMQGFYLPYYLIRGPLDFTITREHTKRIFKCEIFVEKNYINASKELDNLVLDAMEPYDWKEIVPFDFGYISGQFVKIRDIYENELTKRAVEEVTAQGKKLIVDELDSENIEIESDTKNILRIPVLLPVYYYKSGDFTVSVNGQTGRISMTNNHETKKIINYSGWIISVITLTVLLGIPSILGFGKDIDGNYLSNIIALLKISFFTPVWLPFLLLPKNIKIIRKKNPLFSEECVAIRKPDMSISYKYGKNLISNEISKPYFWEKVDYKKYKLKINVIKTSTIYAMSICALFGPTIMPLTLAIYYCFHYNNFVPLIHLFSNKTFLKSILIWYITCGSWFFFTLIVYNNQKYDSVLKEKKDCFVLKGNYSDLFCLIIAIFVSIWFGIGSFDILSQGNELAEKAVKLQVQKSVSDLKQNNARFIEALTNNYVAFNFNEKQRSYHIDFYENNKLIRSLFTISLKKGEKHYCFSKNEDNVFERLYRVYTFSNSFVITDLRTKDRWNIKYSKNEILLQKCLPNEEKTIYSLKLSSDESSYCLYNSESKLIGKTSLRNNNNLLVFREKVIEDCEKKAVYITVNSKPRQDDSMVLASPLVLLIDEFDVNLRYIMLLELSQLE